jgi:(p)ppGpp synthase/HD superfamily hydrolase
MEDKIFQAVEFASFYHRGQFRKGTHIPYIVHPLSVMQLVARFGGTQHMQIAALFHDLLEDTSASQTDIQENFGQEVLELVKGLTEPSFKEDKSKSWKLRKTHTLENLEKQPLEILCVSLCDKYDNLYSIEQDKIVLQEKIWQRFRASYEEQKWYYLNLAKIFTNRLQNSNLDFLLLSKEFEKLCNKLFI